MPGLLLLAVLLGASDTVAETEPPSGSYQVWSCPEHRAHPEDAPGACAVCGRPLSPRRLASAWSCPMHPQVPGAQGGGCPVCGMTLVATTQELEYSCGEDPGMGQPEPGTCPDGTPRSLRRLAMPHGDHNPRHGGLLFMAADGFHHLEGTVGADRRFRLYFYDDFTRPLDARAFTARVADRPLEVAGDHRSLELVGTEFAEGPVEIAVKVRFPGGDREEPFDFVLEDAAGKAARVPAKEPTDLRQAIRERAVRVDELVRRGAWPDLFIPALEAKDLALALLEREGDRVAAPVKTLVRAAWLLDLYGDLGKKAEVEAAQRLFARGVADLEGALGR